MWSSLFPATCLGCGRLLRHDRALALCSTCLPEQGRLPPGSMHGDIAASFAYEGPLAKAVLARKFGGVLALAGPLGRLMSEHPRLDARWDAIVPVPLHWRRRLVRGFDQAEELARALVLDRRRRVGADAPALVLRALRRTRSTRPQTDLDAHERAANVADAFRVVRADPLVGRRVLVIDDVTTTGATLRVCMTALREAGVAELGALALLRTLD